MLYNDFFDRFTVHNTEMSGDFFMILPGFRNDEISVTQNGNKVTVKGKSDRKEDICCVNYSRAYEFEIDTYLADNTQVKRVTLENGILFVKVESTKKKEKEIVHRVR